MPNEDKAQLRGEYTMLTEHQRLAQKLLKDAQNNPATQRAAQKFLHDAHLDQSHLLHKANLDPPPMQWSELLEPAAHAAEVAGEIGEFFELGALGLLSPVGAAASIGLGWKDATDPGAQQRLLQKLQHELDKSHRLHKDNLDPSSKESTQPLGAKHPVAQQPHVNQHPIGQSPQKAHGHSLLNSLFSGPNGPSTNAHSHHPLNSGSSAHVGELALGSQQTHDVHGNNGKGHGAQIPLGGQMQLHGGSVTSPHPGSPHPQVAPPQPVLDFVLQKMHAGQSGHLAPAPLSHGRR